MLTYEQFDKYLCNFIVHREHSEELLNQLEDIFPGAAETFYSHDYQNLFISLFSDVMEDKQEWIKYFIYERNCKWFEIYITAGEGTTSEREEVIQIDSSLKLYNLIIGKI